MNGDKQTMHMKNRQGVNQHITPLVWRSPSPVVFKNQGVAQEIAVGQHGSFGTTGGAAGVQNGR